MATTLQERRQLDRMARRRKIQRVARRIFSERGFAGTTIEDIARKSGLSVGAIYLYFKSKEELYVSLLQESLELFASEVQRLLAGATDPRVQLRAVWDLFVDWSPTWKEFFRILPSANTAPERTRPRPSPRPTRLTGSSSLRDRVSDEVAQALAQAAARGFAAIATIIEGGIAQGVYRAECRETATDVLWATFTGLVALQEARESLEFPAPDFVA